MTRGQTRNFTPCLMQGRGFRVTGSRCLADFAAPRTNGRSEGSYPAARHQGRTAARGRSRLLGLLYRGLPRSCCASEALRNLPNMGNPVSHAARVHVLHRIGRWEEAVADANELIVEQGEQSSPAIMARLTVAWVAMRRGVPVEYRMLEQIVALLGEEEDVRHVMDVACLVAERAWLGAGGAQRSLRPGLPAPWRCPAGPSSGKSCSTGSDGSIVSRVSRRSTEFMCRILHRSRASGVPQQPSGRGSAILAGKHWRWPRETPMRSPRQ